MAFCNVMDHQTTCEMNVKNFPTYLLLSTNPMEEMGSTIIYTANCIRLYTMDAKWEAKLFFEGPRKTINLTLRFLGNSIDNVMRRLKYKFSAFVILNANIFDKKECDISGASLQEFQWNKTVFQYKLKFGNNKKGPTESTIPIEYFGSSDTSNPLKLVLSMTLSMDVDMYKHPSVPVWVFGQEPYTLYLYTNGGWIKTNRSVVTAKCKYLHDRLMEAQIPMNLPAGVNIPDASFVGMQHIIPYFYHGQFVTCNWRRDLSLIVQALGVLQMESLRAHCNYILQVTSSVWGYQLTLGE